MEKVGMDYSWGKVSCHDGHGQGSWTMINIPGQVKKGPEN